MKTNLKGNHKIFILLTIILLILGVYCYVIGKKEDDYYGKKAKELSQCEFGAVIPEICYVDDDKIIIYDAKRVFVYSIEDEKICGYASYPDTDESFVQGVDALIIEASNDGKYIYAHKEEAGKIVLKYSLNVSKNQFKKVNSDKEFKESTWQKNIYQGDKQEVGTTYCIGDAYVYREGYCYLGFEPEGTTYSDLSIVVCDNGEINKYNIFK